MDAPTIAIYDEKAAEYDSARAPIRAEEATEFGHEVHGVRVDVGCGAGRYTANLGHPVVALDASIAMLARARRAAPQAWPVLADLARLPFRQGAIAGAWANMSYHHLTSTAVPMALADLHRSLAVGAAIDITGVHGDYEGRDLPGDDFPGRWFGCWTETRLGDLVVGAGFAVATVARRGGNAWARAHRIESLADTVGPGMRLLVCGMNPSVHAARRGIGYVGPGNRFWPAAVAAGLVDAVNPETALDRAGIGMTDLVKRATPRASMVTAAEVREGMARVERLIEWLQPAAVAFVGLQGYRVAVDRAATAGWQPRPIAGRPVYLMPSTSGMNAATGLTQLATHLELAFAGRQ